MQQHPILIWIKIKTKLFHLVFLWLVHMCVPTTSLLWYFVECAVNSNEEGQINVPEKFKRIRRRIQAGRPRPGRLAYNSHQNNRGNLPGTLYTEPARLQKGHDDWARVQAGRPRAPLVDLSPRAFAWYLFDPSTTLSFLLSFKIYPD